MNPQTKDFHWRGPASPRNELLSSLCHCQWQPRRSLWDVWLRHKKHTIVKGTGAVALAMLPAAGRVGGTFPRLPCLSFITHSISSYILCHIYESLFHQIISFLRAGIGPIFVPILVEQDPSILLLCYLNRVLEQVTSNFCINNSLQKQKGECPPKVHENLLPEDIKYYSMINIFTKNEQPHFPGY